MTGTDARSRPEGLVRDLGQVLAKVAGNPALLDDPRLATLDPTTLLRSFAYLDRMSDQPRHDEQGSRDRPFDLVAWFEPAAIDAILVAWRETPWRQPRPVLAIDVGIRPRDGPGIRLQADTDPDERHRAALLEAADRVGLQIVLPAAGLPTVAGRPVLHGTLRWSEADAGWVGEWRLEWNGAERQWAERQWMVRGVGFDAAYQNALGGAALILSGHR